VLAVTVDYASRRATIGTAAGSDVPRQEIIAALASLGYSGVFLEGEGESPAETQDFADPAMLQQKSLLRRFDDDRSGTLDEREKRALRSQFGDIDVPMLPDKSFDYTTLDLPKHVDRAALAETDSTPADNPITDDGATLGRVLFYDKQLSANGTIACASCHLQQAGFADPRRLSTGFDGGRTGRNAMSLANLRFSNVQGHEPGFFWDERAVTLEDQALMPIQDPVEMGMAIAKLEQRLAGLPHYPGLFEAAFGSQEVTSDRIAKAIAQFMRAMVSMDAAFDRAASESEDYSEPFAAFTEQENLGKSLFIEGVGGILEHGCAHCHVPPTFGMTKAQNNGLAMKYEDQGLGARKLPPNDPFTPSNDGKFKAPSLRNVELTSPYMHDGRFASLEEVIDHYSDSVHLHENLTLAFAGQESASSPAGLNFTAEQRAALVAFLKTLNDENFITDPRFSDPFVRIGPSEK
jgi:cytochrome c peroxidase